MHDNQSPTILIIDNDEGVLSAISTRLEAIGYRCETASSGGQGLSMFDEGGVDLVITDLNMPAGDGVALASAIRARNSTPIIVVTGFHSEYSRELRSVEGLSILQKPFRTDELVELVEAELVMVGAQLPS